MIMRGTQLVFLGTWYDVAQLRSMTMIMIMTMIMTMMIVMTMIMTMMIVVLEEARREPTLSCLR